MRELYVVGLHKVAQIHFTYLVIEQLRGASNPTNNAAVYWGTTSTLSISSERCVQALMHKPPLITPSIFYRIPPRPTFIFRCVITDDSSGACPCGWRHHRRSIVNQQSTRGLRDQPIDSLPGKSIQSKAILKLKSDQRMEDVQAGKTRRTEKRMRYECLLTVRERPVWY